MITSQIFALLGLYKAEHFRTDWPYVVPIHVALYCVHMLQEHFDIYRTYPSDGESAEDEAMASGNANLFHGEAVKKRAQLQEKTKTL